MNDKGNYILEYELKNEDLYVRYQDFWQVLETKYHLKYSDTQEFIQYMVEIAYKLRVKTTQLQVGDKINPVEIAYKLRVKTTKSTCGYGSHGVEIAYKLMVKTTDIKDLNSKKN